MTITMVTSNITRGYFSCMQTGLAKVADYRVGGATGLGLSGGQVSRPLWSAIVGQTIPVRWKTGWEMSRDLLCYWVLLPCVPRKSDLALPSNSSRCQVCYSWMSPLQVV